jgi:hypothetical protein
MIYNDRLILVRAFELARTGDFINVKMLEKALAREGYAKSDPQIHSPSVRRQLSILCRTHYGSMATEKVLVA